MLMLLIFLIMSFTFMKKVLTDNSKDRRAEYTMCYVVTATLCLIVYIIYLIHFDYHSLHYLF